MKLLLKALSSFCRVLAFDPSLRSVVGGGKHSCFRELLRLLCGKAVRPCKKSSTRKQAASGNTVTIAAATSVASLTFGKRLLTDSLESVTGVREVVIVVSYLFNFLLFNLNLLE